MTRREFDFLAERNCQFSMADTYRRLEARATRPRRAAEWRMAAEAAERRAAEYDRWAREARVATQTAGA